MFQSRAVALIALVAAVAAIVAAAPTASGRSTAKVTVTATDFKFKVVPKTVVRGVTTFTVVNRGEATHDFRIAGKKTRILNPGARATLKVTLKKGRYPYLCTVPGHAQLGMKGTLVVK